MIKYILFFLIFNSYNLYSQSEEDLYKFYFKIAKDFHNSSNEKIKAVSYLPQDIFIKSAYNLDTLKKCIDYFEQNAEISLKNNKDKIEVKFYSTFPTYYQEDIFNIFKFKPINSHLIDINKKSIKISNTHSNSIGGKLKENSTSEKEYTSIENISYAETKSSDLKGDLTYQLSFLTDYSTKKLTIDSIGKIIELNKLKYQIVDIVKNKVVLKKLYSEIYDGDIKILIFNKERNLLVFDDGNQSKNSLFWTGKMDSIFYNYISKKDFSSYNNFKKILNKDNLMPKNPEYIIIAGLADIENEFILFEAEYNAQKSFKISVLKK